MAKDYAKKNPKARKKQSASRRSPAKGRAKKGKAKKPAPGLWLVAGLLIGLFVSGLFYLKTSTLSDFIHHTIQKVTTHSRHSHKKHASNQHRDKTKEKNRLRERDDDF